MTFSHVRGRYRLLSEYDTKICTAVFIMVVVCIAVGYIAYIMGYKDAMHLASQMLDEAFDKKFSKAKVVVKKDDRIIECNGMAVPIVCGQCMFGHVNVEGEKYTVECFAPDFDMIPVIGLRKPNDK